MLRRLRTLLMLAGLCLAAPAFAYDPACDYNGDGACDLADADIIRAAQNTPVGDPGFVAAADHDGDGIISPVDLGRFVALLRGI